MIKTVIIDFDDTLCLTEAVCFELENDTLSRMGRAPMTREVHVSTWGQPLFDAITTRSPGIDVEAFQVAYHPVIAEYIADGRLDTIPTANYEALDRLLAMGLTVFVLTSRTHAELKHVLAPDHLLASRIKAFYYKDITRYHKPDPRVFDELLSSHAISARNCVYIGDSVGDAIAAKEAGLLFIASLESGLRQKQDFAQVQVDAYVQKFPDIVAIVEQFKNHL